MLDTGIFDDNRYWVVDVQYAKADPTDILMAISVTNAGPDTELLHVLPTMWYRNTWSWDAGVSPTDARRHRDRGGWRRASVPRSDWNCSPGRTPAALSRSCCSVTTTRILNGSMEFRLPHDGRRTESTTTSSQAPTPSIRSDGAPSVAAWYRLTVGPGETAQVRLRLRPEGSWPGRGDRARRGLHTGRGATTGRGRRVLRRTHPSRSIVR